METRLEKLLQFEKQSPDDTFILYGITLEYINNANHQEAEKYIEKIILNHPNYLPIYYQAAKYYESTQAFEQAINVYKKGIELAQELKENKTLNELQREYNFLLEDLED